MSRDSFVQQAFDLVCNEAQEPEDWYVCLMERVPFFVSPAEGGTWSSDTLLVAYQLFQREEDAIAAEEKIKKLAEDMTQEARNADGEYCLRQMEWLEERGLDADFLPENDGPSEYYVLVSQGLPTPSYGCRHYE